MNGVCRLMLGVGVVTFVVCPIVVTSLLATSTAAEALAPHGAASVAAAAATNLASVSEGAQREADSGALINIGHVFRFLGTIVGVGSLAALLWILRSAKEDLRLVLSLARMLGLVVATGAALEWASYQQVTGVGLGALFTSSRGAAVLLAMVGGVFMTFGLTEQRSLTPTGSVLRWTPGRSSALGLAGGVAVIASYGFDGHQAAIGPNAALVAADIVHIATAALWGGGVCVLAIVGLSSRRRRRPSGLIASVVRLTAIGPWSLVALLASGVGLSVAVSGADAQVASTPWGRTLLVKVILVVIAMAVGLYNRIALLPRVRDGDPDALAISQLRVVLTAEAVFIAGATIVTVALVQLVP